MDRTSSLTHHRPRIRSTLWRTGLRRICGATCEQVWHAKMAKISNIQSGRRQRETSCSTLPCSGWNAWGRILRFRHAVRHQHVHGGPTSKVLSIPCCFLPRTITHGHGPTIILRFHYAVDFVHPAAKSCTWQSRHYHSVRRKFAIVCSLKIFIGMWKRALMWRGWTTSPKT